MINTSKPGSTQGWIVLEIYLDFLKSDQLHL